MIKLYEGAGVNKIILTSTNKELELLDIELNEIQSDNINLLEEFEDKNIKLEDKIYDIEKKVVDYISSLLGKIDELSKEEIFDELESISLSLDTILFDKKD